LGVWASASVINLVSAMAIQGKLARTMVMTLVDTNERMVCVFRNEV
jgi:hypothetical protein